MVRQQRRRQPAPERLVLPEPPEAVAKDARWLEGRTEGLKIAIGELTTCRDSLAADDKDRMLVAVLNELIRRIGAR